MTAASAAYRGYVAAVDAAYVSGGVNTKALSTYASGVILKAELIHAENLRAKKWHSVGHLQIIWVKPLTVGKPDTNGQIDALTLSACIDSSKAGSVDSKGKSMRPAGTPTQSVDEMRMRRIQGVWKADYSQGRKAAKC
ncbi:hypothetical protein ACFV9C_36845 [Kribbella sp. NPDC059898]|uniref:hypothetical protein n=1 Tax=Kribbella sp. NPDC059898 TaxID=3346995 RepID=UPI0036697168